MERAIGEKFKVNDYEFEVVEDLSSNREDGCGRCDVLGHCQICDLRVFGECRGTLRSDKRAVHFELVGKGVTTTAKEGGK